MGKKPLEIYESEKVTRIVYSIDPSTEEYRIKIDGEIIRLDDTISDIRISIYAWNLIKRKVDAMIKKDRKELKKGGEA